MGTESHEKLPEIRHRVIAKFVLEERILQTKNPVIQRFLVNK